MPPLNHSIIIILDKTECLQGANVAGSGALEDLKDKAVALDGWLVMYAESPNRSEESDAFASAAHEWLHNLQEHLTAACATASGLVAACPNL
jgi:hypothetical protein